MPRIPDTIDALLFDMDGVLTDTARVHAAAWKETFDAVMQELGVEPFRPFDVQADYLPYVDGKPRLDGVRSFLGSRAIELPEGTADDPPDAHTVHGVGRRKNDLVVRFIKERGVDVYPSSEKLVREARERGIKTAVVSSSANARDALASVGLDDAFDAWVEGTRIEREGLKGKPAPDTFLLAARDVGVTADRAAVLEDATAGVAAGAAGDFGLVVGVNRADQADALREAGAHVVVDDLAELELPA